MTTTNSFSEEESCPATNLLKLLAGKWKPQIYRLALEGPLRFNGLLRQLPGSNKQSVAVALKELEEAGLPWFAFHHPQFNSEWLRALRVR